MNQGGQAVKGRRRRKGCRQTDSRRVCCKFVSVSAGLSSKLTLLYLVMLSKEEQTGHGSPLVLAVQHDYVLACDASCCDRVGRPCVLGPYFCLWTSAFAAMGNNQRTWGLSRDVACHVMMFCSQFRQSEITSIHHNCHAGDCVGFASFYSSKGKGGWWERSLPILSSFWIL